MMRVDDDLTQLYTKDRDDEVTYNNTFKNIFKELKELNEKQVRILLEKKRSKIA